MNLPLAFSSALGKNCRRKSPPGLPARKSPHTAGLAGQGVARERKAIVDGLRDSVLNFEEGVHSVDPHEVVALLMMTQYFDALRDIGAVSNTILMPHSPSAVGDLYTQLRQAITVGNLATNSATAIAEDGKKRKTESSLSLRDFAFRI